MGTDSGLVGPESELLFRGEYSVLLLVVVWLLQNWTGFKVYFQFKLNLPITKSLDKPFKI